MQKRVCAYRLQRQRNAKTEIYEFSAATVDYGFISSILLDVLAAKKHVNLPQANPFLPGFLFHLSHYTRQSSSYDLSARPISELH